MSNYFLQYRIKNYHHHNQYPHEYNDPQERSFFLVPLYIIVVAFPVLIASTLIYTHWEKKAALVGFLVSLHNSYDSYKYIIP